MGVVSERGKFIFIHIPKNGGLSVYHYLRAHITREDVVVMEGKADPRWFGKTESLHKHAMAYQYKIWCDETGRDWDSYKTFAVVRDPLRRPQSVFNEIRSNADTWGKRVAGPEWWAEFERCRDVEDFILSGLYSPSSPIPMTHRQTEFVTWNDRVIVDELLPIETIWWSVPKILGLPGKAPHDHRGQYVPTVLSKKAIDYVVEHYEDDFLLVQEARGRFHQ